MVENKHHGTQNAALSEENTEKDPSSILSDTEAENTEYNGNETSESNEKGETTMTKTMYIEGMMCPHCEGRVKRTLEASNGVLSATVSHESGTAVVELTDACDLAAIKSAVEAQGYPVTKID